MEECFYCGSKGMFLRLQKKDYSFELDFLLINYCCFLSDLGDFGCDFQDTYVRCLWDVYYLFILGYQGW